MYEQEIRKSENNNFESNTCSPNCWCKI